MVRVRWIVVATLVAAGCSSSEAESATGDSGSDDDGAATETEDGATAPSSAGMTSASGGATSGPDSATSTSTTTANPTLPAGTDDPSATDESGDDSVSFVLRPDGGAANECDPKEQDCPDGDKCTAWANDGGTFWNANRCVEIGGSGVAGDMCMVEGGGVSGVDDCALGFICMNTNEENIGTCIKFCEGQDDDCEPGFVCAIYNDGVLPICLDSCDPLLQDCPEGQSCIDTPNQRFICFNDASGAGGASGEPCPPDDGENSCDPGMWCGPGSTACDNGNNCCTPYCDVTADDCVAPDACVSFYGDGNAPPGLEDVGVCVLP